MMPGLIVDPNQSAQDLLEALASAIEHADGLAADALELQAQIEMPDTFRHLLASIETTVSTAMALKDEYMERIEKAAKPRPRAVGGAS